MQEGNTIKAAAITDAANYDRSITPLDVNEGAKGGTVLRITLPAPEDELAPRMGRGGPFS
jgi:hypothetical protein